MTGMKISLEIDALEKIARELGGIHRQLAHSNHVGKALVREIRELKEVLTPPSAARIVFFVEEGGELKRMEDIMFLKVTEKKKYAIKITDKFGNDAKVDGAPAWASSDASLADVAVSEDGLSAEVTPKGPLGSFKLQVNADADLGEGVKPLLGESETIDLVAGDAENIIISEVVEPAPVPEEPAPEV